MIWQQAFFTTRASGSKKKINISWQVCTAMPCLSIHQWLTQITEHYESQSSIRWANTMGCCYHRVIFLWFKNKHAIPRPCWLFCVFKMWFGMHRMSCYFSHVYDKYWFKFHKRKGKQHMLTILAANNMPLQSILFSSGHHEGGAG